MAIDDELFGGEVLGTVDDVEEAEFDGVGHRDAEVEIPRRVESGRLRVESQRALTLDPSPIGWESCRVTGLHRPRRKT